MESSYYRLYSSLPKLSAFHKFAEIDLDALRLNYRTLRAHVGDGVRAIAVVKADAYGHGAPACVRALLDEGCDFFAVSCMEEAIAVRSACDVCGRDAEILILGYTSPTEASLLARHRLTQTLLSESYALALDAHAAKAGVCVRAHAAINTGMNRIGFDVRDGAELETSAHALIRTYGLKHVALVGMFTHLSVADELDAESEAYTALQVERYRALRARIEACGVSGLFHHVCNSAAAVRSCADGFDGVRLGILLYGVYPALHNALALTPVMRLRANLIHVYRLLPGERVGYGGEFCADTERDIAVIGIGYADGWLRDYAGAEVHLRTSKGAFRAKIVGRVCMDQCMLDVTGMGAHVGDTVTLFGNGAEQLAELSRLSDSIDYEGLCLISARVPRIYVEGGGELICL